jgi:hypothetical protein
VARSLRSLLRAPAVAALPLCAALTWLCTAEPAVPPYPARLSSGSSRSCTAPALKWLSRRPMLPAVGSSLAGPRLRAPPWALGR